MLKQQRERIIEKQVPVPKAIEEQRMIVCANISRSGMNDYPVNSREDCAPARHEGRGASSNQSWQKLE